MLPWTVTDMPAQTGRLALVTGANSGIGFYMAKALAGAGATVILACRDAGKAEAACQRIRRDNAAARLEIAILDLADLTTIRGYAAEFLATGRSLDLLINNAGIMEPPKRHLTTEGVELQFGTNHLGHFVLTGLLLPALARAPAARIVSLSSIVHRGAVIDFDNLNGERGYRPFAFYKQSKLATLVFARELDRRLVAASSPIRSLAAHPGIARTELVINGVAAGRPALILALKATSGLFMQSAFMGALPTLYAATHPDAKGGEYYGPRGWRGIWGYPALEQPDPAADLPGLASQLWTLSEDLTGLHYP